MGNCLSRSRRRVAKSGLDEQNANIISKNSSNAMVCSSYQYRSGSKTFPDAFTNIIDSNQKLLGQQQLNDSPQNEHNPSPEKLIAMFSYESRSEGDLGFEKDDIMYLLDNTNPDWWYVKNSKGVPGYIPRNFVAFLKTPESFDWFAGRISRSVAERLVAGKHLPPGTFLVRERESDKLEYALTIRDIDQGLGVPCAKHYKIKKMETECGFYITKRMIFPSLEALVSYYSDRSDGLCNKLTLAAPKMTPVGPDLCYDTQQNWEIPRHEVQLLRRLGEGNFAEVYYGHWRGKVDVAIKMMKPRTMSSEDFISEANTMKQCQHPNLVRLFAVCTKEEPFYIITEYMKNGNLLDFLRAETKEDQQKLSSPKNPLTIQELVVICAQVADGMKYLEERKLVHRDLAARNVLVGEKISGVPIVKVADFGLARKLMDDEQIYEAQTSTQFPIKWTAPEAAMLKIFTVKSDVWSYGILLYEIFTKGAVPYAGMSNSEVLVKIESGERMKCPYNSNPDESVLIKRIYEQVMLKTWEQQPERRPTFEALYHYFDDFFVSNQPNYIPP
ncbi:hypothetical protein ACQ4LE_003026 [Meloidogyne hapla]